jgi:hypothetical protein
MVLTLKTLPTLLLVLALGVPAIAAENPDPFRTLPTPNGCAIVFDHALGDYRLDRLVDGGVVLGLYKAKFPAQEREAAGGCPGRYRVTSAGLAASARSRSSNCASPSRCRRFCSNPAMG